MNIIEAASRALELQSQELDMYKKHEIDYLININMKKVSLLDDKKAEELYKMGYEQTKMQLKKYALH